MNRAKEQAFKLESKNNLITRLKDEIIKVYVDVAHVLYIQASKDLKMVEVAILAYDNTPGQNGAELTCRYCRRKRGHVEKKDYWEKVSGRKGKVHTRYADQIMINCPKNSRDKKTGTSLLLISTMNVKGARKKHSSDKSRSS